MGAKKRFVFSVILGQSMFIATLGSILGFGIYAIIMSGVNEWVKVNVGLHLQLWNDDPIFWINPILHLIIGLIAGLIPAIKAYQTDVSNHLN